MLKYLKLAVVMTRNQGNFVALGCKVIDSAESTGTKQVRTSNAHLVLLYIVLSFSQQHEPENQRIQTFDQRTFYNGLLSLNFLIDHRSIVRFEMHQLLILHSFAIFLRKLYHFISLRLNYDNVCCWETTPGVRCDMRCFFHRLRTRTSMDFHYR